jgi:hypothetical protein
MFQLCIKYGYIHTQLPCHNYIITILKINEGFWKLSCHLMQENWEAELIQSNFKSFFELFLD